MAFFKDEKPLTAENFSSQHNRAFRSSQIVPYAANLVFVLYECSDGLRVQLFLNEKPMTFPSMNHSAPLYETVRKHYSKLLHGCDSNKECNVPQPNFRNTELWVKLLNSGSQGSVTVHLQWLYLLFGFCYYFLTVVGGPICFIYFTGGHLCFEELFFFVHFCFICQSNMGAK